MDYLFSVGRAARCHTCPGENLLQSFGAHEWRWDSTCRARLRAQATRPGPARGEIARQWLARRDRRSVRDSRRLRRFLSAFPRGIAVPVIDARIAV